MPFASYPEISPAHFSSNAQIEAVFYTSISQCVCSWSCHTSVMSKLSSKMLCFTGVLYGTPGLATEEKCHRMSNFLKKDFKVPIGITSPTNQPSKCGSTVATVTLSISVDS